MDPATATTTEPAAIPWYKSKTIIASAIGILFAILGALRVDLPGIDQETATESIYALITAIAGIAAIYGRVVAARKIGTADAAPKK